MRIQVTQKKGYTDRHGVEHPCGYVGDFPAHLAAKLIRYGIATPATVASKLETVAKAPAENAAKHVGKTAKQTPQAKAVK
jgi:hypothetical protein